MDSVGPDVPVAHQRLIRDRLAREFPREVFPSLDGYTVGLISRDAAKAVILRYEWLGTLGLSSIFVGLISPRGEVEGVACFGHAPSDGTARVLGAPALCLGRGACVHYAPKNAASFLINRACRLVAQHTGIEVFFAYADPEAGEYGAVYQAAGWAYLGQGLIGSRQRKKRVAVLGPGLDGSDPANWKTTRELRRGGKSLGWAEARALGWVIQEREAKHLYAVHVGKARQAWRKAIGSRPYPAPRPALKLKS